MVKHFCDLCGSELPTPGGDGHHHHFDTKHDATVTITIHTQATGYYSSGGRRLALCRPCVIKFFNQATQPDKP